MSEWDDLLETEKQGKGVNTGKWDAGMTIAALVVVVFASFMVSYLTKDIPSRPIWLLFLCFAAPAAALMLAVYLKEKLFPSMTPSSSRKAQLILAICTVIAAGLVGCFCQVSNVEAQGEQTVITHEGWSDLLIVFDKSGSMMTDNRNIEATKAVKALLNTMDDEVQVGLLIDVDWETVPLQNRKIDFGPLKDQRDNLIKLASTPTGGVAYFGRAFDAACKMLDTYTGEGNRAIVVISDGTDFFSDEDSAERFVADNYEDKLVSRGVKVYYLYVDQDHVNEMDKLAVNTGGESIYVSNLSELTEKMQEVAKVPIKVVVYKDALRDIDESNTARIVTGILLTVLGVLIGLTLTIMFSLQGQKRLQLVLSPLMAVLSFLLLAFGSGIIPTDWLREATAFSLLGIVLMRSNRESANRNKSAEVKAEPTYAGIDDTW